MSNNKILRGWAMVFLLTGALLIVSSFGHGVLIGAMGIGVMLMGYLAGALIQTTYHKNNGFPVDWLSKMDKAVSQGVIGNEDVLAFTEILSVASNYGIPLDDFVLAFLNQQKTFTGDIEAMLRAHYPSGFSMWLASKKELNTIIYNSQGDKTNGQ